MANNFNITQGSGTTVATEQGVGTEHYQKIKLVDPTAGATGGIGIAANPLKVDGSAVTQPVSVAAPIQAAQSGLWTMNASPLTLCQSATAASGAALTVTLPAVAGQFHYIAGIEIVRYAAAALTASASPLVVTTTNLPGSLAFSLDTLGALGSSVAARPVFEGLLKSSAANTATTIVCPAATGVIWRVNVFYFTA